MRKKKYYLQPEDIDRKEKKLEEYYEKYLDVGKKLSVNNKICIGQYVSGRNELGDYIHFQFKKDTEAAHLAYCLNEEFSKLDKNIYKEGNKNYDCVNIETPWFNVFDMWYKLRKKYFKGEAFEQEREYLTKNYLFTRLYSWPDDKDVETNVGPSYNPIYKWKSGWEYDLDPMEYRNLKSFMKARIEKIKNLRGIVLEEKIKQMKLQKEREEFKEKERIESEKLRKKMEIEGMQDKRYTDIDIVVKDPGIYVICEKKKTLTKAKNKNNCLYVGESGVLSKRLSAYQDLSKKDNELVLKICKKSRRPVEEVINKLKNNVRLRILRFKNMHSTDQRKEIEGYLINRLNPLANSATGGARRKYFKSKRNFL